MPSWPMTKRVVAILFFFLTNATMPFLVVSYEKGGVAEQTEPKVQRVLAIIAQMEKAKLDPQSRPLQQVVITEDELNAYIAYRIKTEPIEMLQELQLKLFEGNYLEGRAVLDLSQENLPDFIPKSALLFFAASFRVEKGKIYFDFKKIFLGPQELPVDFVSEMIKQIAVAHGEPPEGLNRAYDLPFGIKDIKSKKGLAIFYY